MVQKITIVWDGIGKPLSGMVQDHRIDWTVQNMKEHICVNTPVHVNACRAHDPAADAG